MRRFTNVKRGKIPHSLSLSLNDVGVREGLHGLELPLDELELEVRAAPTSGHCGDHLHVCVHVPPPTASEETFLVPTATLPFERLQRCPIIRFFGLPARLRPIDLPCAMYVGQQHLKIAPPVNQPGRSVLHVCGPEGLNLVLCGLPVEQLDDSYLRRMLRPDSE